MSGLPESPKNANKSAIPWLSKTVLVPCDFAGSSRKACETAIELARNFRVPVLLMHVFPIPTAIYTSVPNIPAPELISGVEESARAALAQEAALFAGKGVEITTMLKMGSAWEEVVERAKRPDIGLIVMGTHGRRGLPRALMGSVAEKVVRLSPVPVLTVHGENTPAESSHGGAPGTGA